MYDEEIDVADAEEVQSLSNRSPEPEVEDFNDSSRMKVRAELKPKVERPQSAKISVSLLRFIYYSIAPFFYLN